MVRLRVGAAYVRDPCPASGSRLEPDKLLFLPSGSRVEASAIASALEYDLLFLSRLSVDPRIGAAAPHRASRSPDAPLPLTPGPIPIGASGAVSPIVEALYEAYRSNEPGRFLANARFQELLVLIVAHRAPIGEKPNGNAAGIERNIEYIHPARARNAPSSAEDREFTPRK